MKHTYLKYIAAVAVVVGLASCEKNNLVIDQAPLTVPEVARFNVKPELSANPYYGYFIEEEPAPGTKFTVPVGVSTVSSADRKVKFTYSSRTAVKGTQFTAPDEITIPAGQAVANLDIQGLFGAYPTGRKDTLKIQISSGDGFVNSMKKYDSIFLIMQKYCPVAIAEMEGDFDNSLEYTASGAINYGPYTISVLDVAPVTATTANAVFENIYGYGGQVAGKFDYTDKGNFKVTIAEQNTGEIVEDSGDLYELWIRTSSVRPSTFSSCDGSITLYIDAIAKEPGTHTLLGYFAQNYKIVLNR
ncbi:MAG: hypothetical protein EOO05_06980 [Chitinophagaceae bacterium]|nr:MAG: hypothetical protein EOO05_06980 [Chitinophagaceae bacterium]